MILNNSLTALLLSEERKVQLHKRSVGDLEELWSSQFLTAVPTGSSANARPGENRNHNNTDNPETRTANT